MVRPAAYSAHPSGTFPRSPRPLRPSRHFSPRKPPAASSQQRSATAIRYAHKLAGYDEPPTSSEVVKATVHGIRRTMGSAPVRKTPATADKARR